MLFKDFAKWAASQPILPSGQYMQAARPFSDNPIGSVRTRKSVETRTRVATLCGSKAPLDYSNYPSVVLNPPAKRNQGSAFIAMLNEQLPIVTSTRVDGVREEVQSIFLDWGMSHSYWP